MRVLALLRKAAAPPPQAWPKNDLYDALFYLRIVVAVVMGMLYGALGAQGLMIFLSCVLGRYPSTLCLFDSRCLRRAGVCCRANMGAMRTQSRTSSSVPLAEGTRPERMEATAAPSFACCRFMGLNIFVGKAWLKWQNIDETEYEDPDKINQSPLTFEGFAPAVAFFVLLWVTSFNVFSIAR
ncbi:hypothetical protein ABPG75_008116 [Micractinium tetrahymenae]